MTINVRGPDGSNLAFPDGTPESEITTAMDAHYGGGADPASAEGGSGAPSINQVGRSLAEGVPVIGPLLNKANAATIATLAPTLNLFAKKEDKVAEPTWSGRYEHSLRDQNKASQTMAEEHPYLDPALKMAGGAAAFGAAGAAIPGAARALGMSGTLPQMVGRGATSGAVIGGADAAARGESPVTGAAAGAVTGAAFPVVGQAVGAAARGVRNLVGKMPRIRNEADLAGVQVPVPESYITRDNAAGSHEQQALAGSLGPESQQVAQQAVEGTTAATRQAADQFGGSLNPAARPGEPVTPHAAAGQTITELAQQHNDQIVAQARHEAQLAAEGASIRGNVAAPLGTPEPAQPRAALDAVQGVQAGLQRAQQASAANRTNLYSQASQVPGEFHPAAFSQIGDSVRNQINRVPPGGRPVTVNPQLTPHASAMVDMLDNRLGNNYYENALRRGDMIRTPDGRVVPRPLTPADVESARQEMVAHLRDANNAARAPGGSGTDAYAAQRVMHAFDRHLDAALATPGAFSGDGAAYRQSILAARQAHATHRATFSNQGNGDTIGPVIERMTGRHPGQEMPPAQMAQAMFGTPTAPGGGNSVAIAQRVRDIVGHQSPEWQAARQGLLSHLLDTPEGMDALSPAKQADRLHAYLATPHSRTMFSAQERTRLLAHANDLRAQAQAAPAQSSLEKELGRLAGADGHPPATPSELVKKLFPATGVIQPGAEKLLDSIHAMVSRPTWDGIRQAMWHHLLERPEGVTEFGPQALSQRLARFLSSPIAESMYSERERTIMRQFAEHYAKLTPLPNTTNPSGSATTAAKLVRASGNHIMALLGAHAGGLPGALVGETMQHALRSAKTASQTAKTKDLFLGKKGKGALNPNYSRAAAIIGHAAATHDDRGAAESR